MKQEQWQQVTLGDDFFRMLVESQIFETFVCDRQGTVIYCNSASEYITGRKRENMLGKNIQELVDDGTISSSVTLEVLKTEQICTITQDVSNGHTLLAIGVPIFDEENHIQYVMTSSQDIQELAIKNSLVEKNQKLMEQLEGMEMYRNEYFSNEDLLFVGDVMDRIINTIRRVTPIDVTVIILGETGVGKEGIAKFIHSLGKGKNKPFFKINCGMIPEHLFESELFGYEAGAFTGASKGGKKGKVELAKGGTLFLDEVGELPMSMQVKLLEFLQDKTFVRVGGVKRVSVDTHVVAATNRDLKAMCEAGDFRWDLYYRLNVLPFFIPPLRERMDEIIHLAQFMLYKCNKKYNLNKVFDKNICTALREYDWPGNLRELDHVIERLYITTDSKVLDAQAMKDLLSTNVDKAAAPKIYCSDIMPLKVAKAEIERQLLDKAYKEYGSSYKVAKALEVDQSTVVKLKKRLALGDA